MIILSLINELSFALSQPIIKNALIVGALISISAAILGVVLVLKRYALIGHGLGEVGFFAMALGVMLGFSNVPTLFAIPIVIAAAIIIMLLGENEKLGGDVMIGVISTSALSLGIIIQSLTKGFKQDLQSLMFGSLYGMTQSDVIVAVALSVISILVFVLFINKFFALTYDEQYFKTLTPYSFVYKLSVAVLTAVTVVCGMRMMGAMLMSSFIIFPAVTAKSVVKSFKGMVFASALISVLSFFTGMILSYIFNLPTGASIAATQLIVFFIVKLISLLIRR